jgi:hypothetical protein
MGKSSTKGDFLANHVWLPEGTLSQIPRDADFGKMNLALGRGSSLMIV